ncbi:MAG: NAD(P)H-dependent oxidoreductase [Pseudomonadota bacterium]
MPPCNDQTIPRTDVVAIVWHSRTGASEQMAEAVAEGAGEYALLRRADNVTLDELRASGAFVFVCPENLGTMSGMMKEMFDRFYYPLLGQVEGRAYATIVAAGSDGSGAEAQIDRIVTGWRLKRVADGIIVNFDAQTSEAILAPKFPLQSTVDDCRELGAGLKEGLQCGVF